MDFNFSIPDMMMPNVEAEMAEHNATPAPPTGGLLTGALNPQMVTPEAFLKYKLEEMVRGWIKKHGLLRSTVDPNAVPEQVPRKQGLKALARATQIGLPAPIYEEDILAYINVLPETTPEEKLLKVDLKTEFLYAPTWIKANPYFIALATGMGISETQRDALLRLAATLQD